MNKEIEETVDLERIRFENFALASNAQTSPKYIKELFKEERIKHAEELMKEQLAPDEDYELRNVPTAEWVTPDSVSELEDFLKSVK